MTSNSYFACFSCGAKFYENIYKKDLQRGSCPRCDKPDIMLYVEFKRRKQFDFDISSCNV